jgi:hypothetical protein
VDGDGDDDDGGDEEVDDVPQDGAGEQVESSDRGDEQPFGHAGLQFGDDDPTGAGAGAEREKGEDAGQERVEHAAAPESGPSRELVQHRCEQGQVEQRRGEAHDDPRGGA